MLAALGGAALGSALGGGIGSLFNKNPADAASPFLNQIPGELHKTYDPYINRGNEQYGALNSTYGRMSQNPVEFLNQILNQYAPSRSYQLRRDEATQAAGNSAAAGGVRGNLNDIINQSRLTDALLGDDMQQWLNNVLGIQGAGIGGQQHIYDQGFNAASALGGDLSNVLGSQATNAFQGQQQKNQNMNNIFSLLGGLGGAGLGGYFGGSGGGSQTGNTFMETSSGNRYRL